MNSVSIVGTSIIGVIGALTLATNFIVEFLKNTFKLNGNIVTAVAFITAMVCTFVAKYLGCVGLVDLEIFPTIIVGLLTGLSASVGFDKLKECYQAIIEILK